MIHIHGGRVPLERRDTAPFAPYDARESVWRSLFFASAKTYFHSFWHLQAGCLDKKRLRSWLAAGHRLRNPQQGKGMVAGAR